MGNISNQKFCIIPHAKFIEKLQYKGELVGINVIPQEENLTSKTDHLAYEKMELRDKKEYLGERKKRGLFQSSTKRLINADVNGAIGIGRKVFGDSVIKQIVDSGLAFNPIKLNIV